MFGTWLLYIYIVENQFSLIHFLVIRIYFCEASKLSMNKNVKATEFYSQLVLYLLYDHIINAKFILNESRFTASLNWSFFRSTPRFIPKK